MTDKAFIDIAVLDPIRSALLAGRGVVVFDTHVEAIVWANGSAAQRFGAGTVNDVLESGFACFAPARQQILAAARSSADLNAVLIRVLTDEGSQLLRANVSTTQTHDGETLIVAVFGDESRSDDLQAAISGLDDEEAGVAIFDAHGTVLASNGVFKQFDIAQDVLQALGSETAREFDRLVKRLVSGNSSNKTIAAGIGRLRDGHDPRYLLIGMDLEQDDRPIVATPAPREPESKEAETRLPSAFVFDGTAEPVRFVWKMDADGVFSELSDELAKTIGPNAADIIGKSFKDVAHWLAIDTDKTIASAIERRDTWSGKTIHWPVENTALRMAVDLAALPYYNRERVFEGYRGFGVVRVSDTSDDPQARGMNLFAPPAQEKTQEPAPATPKKKGQLDASEKAAFAAIRQTLSEGQPEPEMLSEPDHVSAPAGLTADMLDGLPLAILIVRNQSAVFANKTFELMTGYEGLDALNGAGGLDALLDGPADDPEQMVSGASIKRAMTLIAADNSRFAVRAHMQAIPFEGTSALMFAFEPVRQSAPSSQASGNLVDAAQFEARIEELESILDIASDGIVILKPDGTIRTINGPGLALFGYNRAELEGQSFSLLFAHESQRAAMDYLYAMTDNGVASILNEGLEVIGREEQGGFLPLFMTMGRLPASDMLCAVMRDITPWKQSEQAMADAKRTAEEASASKSDFLAKISHEIRTPLNAIIGFSELIQEERFGPLNNQRYKDYLADINQSGRHVLDLVNDLLDLSKIEAGKQDMNFEGVDLNAVTAGAISMVQPQASKARILMRSSLAPDLPPVVADTRAIRQIILNLLSNAIRFTPAGGLIVASTSYTPKTGVTLRIKDTGVGMTAKELEIAMEPFQQVSESTAERNDGTGLGLPLTKALADANRAEFSIQSEQGRGTIVEILFPENRVLIS